MLKCFYRTKRKQKKGNQTSYGKAESNPLLRFDYWVWLGKITSGIWRIAQHRTSTL
jgi:hypothetical protein